MASAVELNLRLYNAAGAAVSVRRIEGADLRQTLMEAVIDGYASNHDFLITEVTGAPVLYWNGTRAQAPTWAEYTDGQKREAITSALGRAGKL